MFLFSLLALSLWWTFIMGDQCLDFHHTSPSTTVDFCVQCIPLMCKMTIWPAPHSDPQTPGTRLTHALNSILSKG